MVDNGVVREKDLGVHNPGVVKDLGVAAQEVEDDGVGAHDLGVPDMRKDRGVAAIASSASFSSISTPSSRIVMVTLSWIPFNSICPLK